jgi:hypothetical protein
MRWHHDDSDFTRDVFSGEEKLKGEFMSRREKAREDFVSSYQIPCLHRRTSMSTILYLSTRVLFNDASHMHSLEKVGVPPKRKDLPRPKSTEPIGSPHNEYRV